MKKLLLIIPIFLLMNCEVKVDTQSSNAQTSSNETYFVSDINNYGINGKGIISVTVYEKDGIEYRIFTNNGYGSKSIFVVNHTKELLEVELLKSRLLVKD